MENSKIFEPLLTKFCETAIHAFQPEVPGIFLPHTMSGYNDAKTKIFYIGRDTYGWINNDELKKNYLDGKLIDYINNTPSWLNGKYGSTYGFLQINNNSAYGFWTLAMKLHLKLKCAQAKVAIRATIPENYRVQLNDFGWGNTNSVEIKQSIEKRVLWSNINEANYKIVKTASKKLDRLKHTMDAFCPSLVFIFNWETTEAEFLSGIKWELVTKLPYADGKFLLIKLPEYSSYIIWTMHPNSIRFIGYTVDKLIKEIVEVVDAYNLMS